MPLLTACAAILISLSAGRAAAAGPEPSKQQEEIDKNLKRIEKISREEREDIFQFMSGREPKSEDQDKFAARYESMARLEYELAFRMEHPQSSRAEISEALKKQIKARGPRSRNPEAFREMPQLVQSLGQLNEKLADRSIGLEQQASGHYARGQTCEQIAAAIHSATPDEMREFYDYLAGAAPVIVAKPAVFAAAPPTLKDVVLSAQASSA